MTAGPCALLGRVTSIDGGTGYRLRVVCTCADVPRIVADYSMRTRTAARRELRRMRARHAWRGMEDALTN